MTLQSRHKKLMNYENVVMFSLNKVRESQQYKLVLAINKN